MIVNWDDISENSYINEAGKYTLKVMSFENKVTANGTECHVFTCETKDKASIKVNLYVVEKALWKYKAFVKACGIDPKGSSDLATLAQSLIGRKFVGEVTRQRDQINVETGLMEQSKYFEVSKFYKLED